ncbi:hypothetical protein N431DRAFT_458754 [Stipitochalara longipes BDJ]|nr:hypothetical protein N431DRAFT_458754 [Stipitochalara longipes BDJ]
MLSNNGISEISGSDGTMRLSVRAPDALPISEFDSRADGAYYGLPGLALMQFEGSGVQSNWTLQFLPAANPAGFSDLMDVLVTFDMRAQYDVSLAQTQLANQPTTTERFVVLSALKSGAPGLQQLQVNTHGTATVGWDGSVLDLSRRESGRKINNIFFALVGPTNPQDVTATVKCSSPAQPGPGDAYKRYHILDLGAHYGCAVDYGGVAVEYFQRWACGADDFDHLCEG